MKGQTLHFSDTASDSLHMDFQKSAYDEILNHTIYPPIHFYDFHVVSFLYLLVAKHFQYHPDSVILCI